MKNIQVSKAVIEQEGEYLLLKRAAHSAAYPSLWDFPGGKHDPGESPQESVVREVQEETALVIEPGPEVKTATHQDDEYHIVFHYFTPISAAGELKLSADHSDYRWVKKDELKSLALHPSVMLFFKDQS